MPAVGEIGPLKPYVVRARNTAALSDNRIHDDVTARVYGFKAGLVPGATLYAYMTHPIVEAWGARWLEGGNCTVRFVAPVYEDAELRIVATGRGAAAHTTLTDESGRTCATGSFAISPQDGQRKASRVWFHPWVASSAQGLRRLERSSIGVVLDGVTTSFGEGEATDYLRRISEESSIFKAGAFAHPGWLLGLANRAFRESFRLGPWIHARSDVQNFGRVGAGDTVTISGLVSDVFEKRGNSFAVLHLAVTVADRLVQRVRHTVIYRPRIARSG